MSGEKNKEMELVIALRILEKSTAAGVDGANGEC